MIGEGKARPKGYYITDACIGCGKCVKICPQNAIESGKPSMIHQEHCLHCGNCFENCPVKAIERQG
ncbi:MAG: 4Fe-4S binding protein [Oscillospiraceae bacterium]|nr:4Fe-4S binding protein [Oscillospiraceae bacterium]